MSSDAAGWYGKVATLGDFAHRRLPPDFVRRSDAWLAGAMSASRAELGERWLDCYLTAPLMRFAWAPGVAGDAQWWFGVLMPSCDNVGRYFPLLIASPRSRPPLDRIAIDHLDAWFDHLADAATHTLAERASLDGFEKALADAPPWPTPGTPHPMAQHAAADGTHYAFATRASLNQWLHAIAIRDLHARFAGCSVWWRRGAGAANATAHVYSGLPEPAAFAGMLAG